jgi:hypothetical protein
VGQNLLRHAASRVSYFDLDPAARIEDRRHGDGVLARVPFFHGLHGVDNQVEKHLSETRLVPLHEGNGLKLANHPRTVLELVPGHAQRRFQNAMDIDGAEGRLRRA